MSATAMTGSPVSIHDGNLARAAVAASAPEGVLLAPTWKRGVAFGLDLMLITLVISLLTGGKFYSVLMDISYLISEFSHYWFLHLFIHLITCYLYFKYSGRRFHRSLGQRAMRIAIVHDDGTLLKDMHWNKRAMNKVRYVIPILGQVIGIIEFLIAVITKEHLTPLEKSTNTIAVVDWTLPTDSRFGLG